MFQKVEPLTSEKHQDLRFSRTNSFSFASKTNLIQLSYSELRPASRFYPIVFPANQPDVPHAVLSLTPENNSFVDSEGNWKASYIPFIIRSYPFLMLKTEQDESKYALCIDTEADHFKQEYGDILFTADGKPNDFTNNILKSLNTYYQEIQKTKKVFRDLNEKEAMIEQQINFDGDSSKKPLGGFKIVDIKKITSMEDGEIAQLVKTGIMPIIYDHIQSIGNFKLLAGKTN
ncbi:MAG: SapC family protein [Nanobdellota archaeon]